MKKIVWIDMDGVLCDYYNTAKKFLAQNPKVAYPQSVYGFFIDLPPILGAIQSYKELEKHFDVRILTRASHMNINCYSEKAYWVRKHLGLEAQEKMVFSGDKSIVKGDYLIDDTLNAKQDEFTGTLIRFGTEEFNDWFKVMGKLRKLENF